jgi:hypothetical protein
MLELPKIAGCRMGGSDKLVDSRDSRLPASFKFVPLADPTWQPAKAEIGFLCEKDPKKQKFGMQAFKGTPMFNDASNLASTGRDINSVTGRPQDMPQDQVLGHFGAYWAIIMLP